MTNSRNKGSAFERDIAKRLFLLTGIVFTRNLEQSRTGDECDLIADDPAWPFSLELKCYKSGNGPKNDWIAQAERGAKKNGKLPALIWKFNYQDVRCAVPFRAINPAWDEDEWAHITLDGLAYIAAELMAGDIVKGGAVEVDL
jgi:Holliday junction resolvase